MTTITAHHFSDVLYVWAYIAQIRVAELKRCFADAIVIEHRYFSVFGDVPAKITQQWQARGGAPAYAEHVRQIAAQFDHVRIHPRAWAEVVPHSSMPAHLLLCAARLLARNSGVASTPGPDALDSAMRHAFFADGQDISRAETLHDVADRAGFEYARLAELIDSGQAYAALAGDQQAAGDLHIRASPTMVFNEGRQMLTGNVGYRVLEANVRELLHHPSGQQSWC